MSFADLCLPQGNEESFLAMARRLGTTALVMAYQERLPKQPMTRMSGIAVFTAVLSTKGAKGGDLSVLATPQNLVDQLHRSKPDIVTGLEDSPREDFLHHRNSGLNQVACAMLKEKGAIVAFDLSSVLRLQPQQQGVALGRMQQNIMLCRKHKVPMALASFARTPYEMRAPHELASFFSHLGMDGHAAKEGLAALYERAMHNREARQGKRIGASVRVMQHAQQD